MLNKNFPFEISRSLSTNFNMQRVHRFYILQSEHYNFVWAASILRAQQYNIAPITDKKKFLAVLKHVSFCTVGDLPFRLLLFLSAFKAKKIKDLFGTSAAVYSIIADSASTFQTKVECEDSCN